MPGMAMCEYSELLKSLTLTASCRGNAFYLINVAYMFDELFAPAMANWSMRISLDVPFGLAWGYLGIGSLLALTIPDYPKNSSSRTANGDRVVGPSTRSSSLLRSVYTYFQTLRPITESRSAILTLPIFFVGMFRMAIISVMMQFPRIRFDWTLLQVTELFTATAIMNLVIFLGIVPYCLWRLRSKYATTELGIQIMLVRCSLISTGLGCLLIGIAQAPVVLCLGKFQCLTL